MNPFIEQCRAAIGANYVITDAADMVKALEELIARKFDEE